MPRVDLLPQTGTFYKANLHCHSTVSDGALTPEQLKKLYRENGYSVLVYTDHERLRDHSRLNEPDFLTLSGLEMETVCSWTRGYAYTAHFGAIAPTPMEEPDRPLLPPEDPAAVNTVLADFRRRGFFLTLNHPAWSAQTVEDCLSYEGFHAVEIYNHGCETDFFMGDSRSICRLLLNRGRRIFCTAADDNHNPEVKPGSQHLISDSCGGWTMIKAPALTYEDIFAALMQGHFYASNGPEIHELYIEEDVLHVSCSPVSALCLRTNALGVPKQGIVSHPDGTITSAAFPLDGLQDEKYRFFWLHLTDAQGRRAWANPVWL